jgi:uncharacterized protein (DUF2062 family)
MSFARRPWTRIRTLWQLAKNERASPKQIGWAVGIGAFSGCTPAPGLHGWIAVGLATLFRLNRLFAWLGSRISFFMIYPWIVIAEVELAHRARTGEWVEISKDTAVAKADTLVLDWCIGAIPVGAVLGAICGLAAYGLALRRDRKKKAGESSDDARP